MNKNEAIQLIKSVFNGQFEEKSFQLFITNLLKNYSNNDFSPNIKNAYKPFIEKYKVIGSFKDNENNQIDILVVYLNKTSVLERARTSQRNFVADYLKDNNKNAALVAFIAPDENDWRFSLVKLEYSLEVKEGEIKTNEEVTPAKRWSFLVGKNERNHTAQSRFVELLISNDKPNLAEIEQAFDIETVTKEFFNKYTELFHKLREHLDNLVERDVSIRKDFEEKDISTVDFAKKTLGQIVFLYFLQKKGWFGVAPDKNWGDGPKNFMRELFRAREKYSNNFFNDVLEPLFYEALAQDRGERAIYTRLNNCRMPFLNGGLFEPICGYSWETTNIVIPDELFSNNDKDAKTGDTGTGILDVFDRYNFTVNENEPLEKEVAVDPEMLGKVFENLLEIKDRKSKGAFYTPREIVHYMCQESLINYLESETENKIPRADLEFLIQKGDRIIENDKIALEKTHGGKYQGYYKVLLPESIRSRAQEIDNLLKNIKVCDPAVGSGAFPLGMINEIVRARMAIGVHTGEKNNIYQIKKQAITHSIYGVDIDLGAVEIAKLRLWLSLIVDAENPEPLPNLDHKIMQGNSLISEYEGIKLFDDELLGQKKAGIEQLGMNFEANINYKMEELKHTCDLFIKESHRTEKSNLKNKIDSLKWELIEETLREQGKLHKLEEIKKLRKRNIKPFFIWKLEFSEVFKEKGGFDVVIGNPPYVGEKGNKEIFRPIAKGNLGRYYQGKMDLFYFFFHLALDLGRENTQNAFITTNYYITALGARKFRADLKERSSIRNLINFNELRIFESALGQHNMITIYSKGQDEQIKAKTCITKRIGTANEEILKTIVSGKDKETDYFFLDQKSLFDGEENYIRLGGVGNFDSPIEKILEKIKTDSLLLNEICFVNQGLRTGADKVTQKHIKEYGLEPGYQGKGIFILKNDEIDSLKLNFNEKTKIKPLFKNSDLNRYYSRKKSNFSLIDLFFPNDKTVKLNEIPNIFKHLLQFEKILKGRKENANGIDKQIKKGVFWFASVRRKLNFELPKIISPQRSKINTFGYNEIPWYASADVYFITSKENSKIEMKYILALLNSKLYYQWLYHRGKRKGEILELYQVPLSEIPVKKISPGEQKPFIDLVDQILDITSTPDYDPKKPPIRQKELEARIDEMVFDLYELTEEEREMVRKS